SAFCLSPPPPPTPTPFPYTTLFRSLLEERLLARRGGVTVRARTQPRRFARPDEHLHAESLSVPRHDGADPAVAEDSQRLSAQRADRKSTRLNSSHLGISYAVFCLKK